MPDRIFTKTKKGGIWEKNAAKGMALYLILWTIVFFTSPFVIIFLLNNILPDYFIPIWYTFITIYFVYKCFDSNLSDNMSKSTAFIIRDNTLYAIQLLYANQVITYDKKETKKSVNDDEEIDIQECENEIRERRKNIESFIYGLDDILEYLKTKPKEYKVKSNRERNILENIFKYNWINAGMTNLSTKHYSYGFLKLNNPTIVKIRKKYFKINYYNEDGELCSAKFSNCYDNLLDYIKNNY